MRFFFSFVLLFSVVFAKAQQLVLPGDHPDPSVVKIGNEYWAAGTTSNWFPAFPMYHSKDLVHWTPAGHIFTKMPEWADYYLWAPEITYDNGKVYVYYTGHKKGGNLCIAAAVADKPEGPYKDLGPLMCQSDGSIDAFPMRDENGKLYIIWKEDGNSIGQPTPIWAAEMKEDRTALIGEKKELFRADVKWERGLVEGVSMIRHNGYFYALYAAAGCCGKTCTYGTGVARAKSLLGPWEKYSNNPVLADDADWKCQGHGTPVEKDGKFFFLYHGYSTVSGAYGGRQGLLNEFEFTSDGWLRFINKKEYGAAVKVSNVIDNFSSAKLSQSWHWSVFQDVQFYVNKNILQLNALPIVSGAYLGQSVLSVNYEATVAVQKSTASAGLALIGDDKNTLCAYVAGDKIQVVQLEDGKETVLAESKIAANIPVTLKVAVINNTKTVFSYSTDGKVFKTINDKAADASFLPPWDRAVRVGLVAKGAKDQSAFFKNFSLKIK